MKTLFDRMLSQQDGGSEQRDGRGGERTAPVAAAKEEEERRNIIVNVYLDKDGLVQRERKQPAQPYPYYPPPVYPTYPTWRPTIRRTFTYNPHGRFATASLLPNSKESMAAAFAGSSNSALVHPTSLGPKGY